MTPTNQSVNYFYTKQRLASLDTNKRARDLENIKKLNLSQTCENIKNPWRLFVIKRMRLLVL